MQGVQSVQAGERERESMAESTTNVGCVLDSLGTIPLFQWVNEEDLRSIAELLIERRYPKNAMIVEEGLPGDYMYILRSGRVKVTKASDDGREKIMDFFEAGAFFGEMALLDESPRSASVQTLEPVTLLALSRRDFLKLLAAQSRTWPCR